MNIADRISPLTILLDEVFYKSAIQDMRKSFFFATKKERTWLLLSDYYFADEKPNKVITFSTMPSCPYFPELQNAIKAVTPKDIKNTRSINPDFVKLINLLPLINIVFIFENNKHFIWDTPAEAKAAILDQVEILRAYIGYWRTTEPASIARLERITRNLNDLESPLKRGKKLRIISADVSPLIFLSIRRNFYPSRGFYPFPERSNTGSFCSTELTTKPYGFC